SGSVSSVFLKKLESFKTVQLVPLKPELPFCPTWRTINRAANHPTSQTRVNFQNRFNFRNRLKT
ncbi:hypothetical protein, partial [Alcaligenes phenolicus]|uniref:hypothetical protein n=1 Tax=Alcaligenes phenolicus TaxID=232846 RepID=UPI002657520B